MVWLTHILTTHTHTHTYIYICIRRRGTRQRSVLSVSYIGTFDPLAPSRHLPTPHLPAMFTQPCDGRRQQVCLRLLCVDVTVVGIWYVNVVCMSLLWVSECCFVDMTVVGIWYWVYVTVVSVWLLFRGCHCCWYLVCHCCWYVTVVSVWLFFSGCHCCWYICCVYVTVVVCMWLLWVCDCFLVDVTVVGMYVVCMWLLRVCICGICVRYMRVYVCMYPSLVHTLHLCVWLTDWFRRDCGGLVCPHLDCAAAFSQHDVHTVLTASEFEVYMDITLEVSGGVHTLCLCGTLYVCVCVCMWVCVCMCV